ncbi:helix-turn-helix domain-containing protein [Phenylobacterium sp.]|uniref:helix-turn-helix domain-containing protein n=1 Tax=Phenylobacterium sp. TaxID=1871053 RepID=UPI002719E23A|nr:helix-turn-helix domain-containing protein [Phenylobacterium sp.]MDO8379058.1 helix-turn-helix domain-containing protein [Phenylobacterium sp.]
MTQAHLLNEAQATTAFGVPAVAPANDVMSRMGVRMTFAKDEEIYGQDEEADFIYRVVSGAVRTSRLMSDGRRQIGGFYYAEETFGVETNGLHRFSAEALSDCVVLVLKASALRSAVGEDAFQRLVWAETNRELSRTQDHLLLLGRKTASEKVASFLMELAERRSAEAVTLPMGRQDMADYLGLTIETVSRMLTQLQSALVVEFTGARRFRVNNRGALARMAA